MILILLNVLGCSSVRESAGVNRKVVDEYKVVENPPLVIPPDYSLVPPDQLKERNIEKWLIAYRKKCFFLVKKKKLCNNGW